MLITCRSGALGRRSIACDRVRPATGRQNETKQVVNKRASKTCGLLVTPLLASPPVAPSQLFTDLTLGVKSSALQVERLGPTCGCATGCNQSGSRAEVGASSVEPNCKSSTAASKQRDMCIIWPAHQDWSATLWVEAPANFTWRNGFHHAVRPPRQVVMSCVVWRLGRPSDHASNNKH